MRVLICGGGIIGTSIAYFLSLRGIEAVVIERHAVAGAASGKSGGFLAQDWCDGAAWGPLARRSFELHAALAEEHPQDWGYRRVDTFAAITQPGQNVDAYRRLAGPSWLGSRAAVHGRLGTADTTAQVIPGAFTKAMMSAARDRGAELRIGCVTGLSLSPDGSAARGVEVDGETLAGDAVVIAMGPWSILARDWLPLPPVYGLKGHSIVLRAPAAAEALFLDYRDADGESHAPEIFPRPDGTVYICGLSGQNALPVDPSQVAPENGAIDKLRAMTAHFAPDLNGAELLAGQACYRPVSQDGMPLMGSVTSADNAYVATGHSCWGILNAPATGEAMAELIADNATTHLDLSDFDPARFAPHTRAR